MSFTQKKRKSTPATTDLPAEKKHKADAEFAALSVEQKEALEWENNCGRRLTITDAETLRLLALALVDPQSTVFKSLASARLYDKHIPAALVKPFLVESVRVTNYNYIGECQSMAVNNFKNRLEVLISRWQEHRIEFFSLDARRRHRTGLQLPKPDAGYSYVEHAPLPDGGAYLLAVNKLRRIDEKGKSRMTIGLEPVALFMSYDKVSGNLAVGTLTGVISVFSDTGVQIAQINQVYGAAVTLVDLFCDPAKRRWVAVPSRRRNGFASVDMTTLTPTAFGGVQESSMLRPRCLYDIHDGHCVYDEKGQRFLAIDKIGAFEVDKESLQAVKALMRPRSWSLGVNSSGRELGCFIDVHQDTGYVYVLNRTLGLIELFFAF